MVSPLLSTSLLVVVCSAGYIPPYYGGFFDDHGSDYSDRDYKYGGYGGVRRGHREGYEAADYGKTNGEEGHYEGDYGSRGAAEGHINYANGGADGYNRAHHDEGARHAADADGMKKYSYFSSGSGPEGTYSKGYYGSEGYNHADSKSKYAANANSNGYKKGFNYDENDHAHAHSTYDKMSQGAFDFGKKNDAGYYGFKKDGFQKAGHADGWYNGEHAARGAHGPY